MLLLMGSSHMQMVAQGYLTYDITSSAAILGLVSSGFAVPILVLSPFGGAIADRFDRKRIMQAGQVVAGLAATFVAVSVTTGTITWVHLFIVDMIVGGLFAFVMPARQATIPQLVGQRQLTNAMALNAAGMSGTTVLAPVLAGFLYAAIGADGVHYVIAAMALGSVLLTAMLPKLERPGGKSRANITREIRAGLSYIRSSPLLIVLLAVSLTSALLAWPFRMLLPVFVQDIYQRGPEAMGLLTTSIGVGSLAGALAIAALGSWRRGILLIAGMFIIGAVLLMVALLPFYFVAMGLMAIFGVGEAISRTVNMALVIELSEDQYRGRVMSVFMMNYGLMPLALLPLGVAAELLGGQMAVGIVAILLLFIAVAVLATQKMLRDLW
jgi:MFS family permease